jgi:GxxExxY protein
MMGTRGLLEHEGLSGAVIGAAIAVHKELGPGLLESAYESCLSFELSRLGIAFQRQLELPVMYKGNRVDCGYRLDIVVEGTILVELKSVDKIALVHEAQLLTYLRLSRLPVGFLMNFNTGRMTDGIMRRVLKQPTGGELPTDPGAGPLDVA